MTESLQTRIAVILQTIVGGALLVLAVSARFDFEGPITHIRIFASYAGGFIVPAMIITALKCALAFLGSWLLMRRKPALPEPTE